MLSSRPSLSQTPAAIRSSNGPATGGRGTTPRPVIASLFQPLPMWIWVLTGAVMLWSMITPQPLLTAFCVLALPVMASLLLFRGESPILFWCCALQWLQAAGAVFYSGFYGVELDVALSAPQQETATWLSVTAVLVLSVGMRLALNPRGRGEAVGAVMVREAAGMNLDRAFWLWALSFVVATIAGAVGWLITSIHQFLVPFTNVKWVFFLILAYSCFCQRKGFWFLGIAMMIEFANGLLGFFSSFKEVLFMFVIAAQTVRIKLQPKMGAIVVLVLTLGVVTSVFWSTIKPDYRAFLSRGWEKGGASMMERFDWLTERMARYDSKTFNRGIHTLINRVSYTSLFGQTLNHVPRFEPHTNGELWYGAVKHVFTPRFIFRKKEIVDDSERARRFTGMRIAGRESGTSMGIGYVTESYVDFGQYGMFVPIFLLGLMMGRIYQVAISNRQSTLLGVSIGTALLFSVLYGFETSNVKIFGTLVLLSLAYWALNKVLAKDILAWLRRPALR